MGEGEGAKEKEGWRVLPAQPQNRGRGQPAMALARLLARSSRFRISNQNQIAALGLFDFWVNCTSPSMQGFKATVALAHSSRFRISNQNQIIKS